MPIVMDTILLLPPPRPQSVDCLMGTVSRGMLVWLLLAVPCGSTIGCYAPLHSYGIPAKQLPESYRLPTRTCGPKLNFATLTLPPVSQYRLGPDDVLEVHVFVG